MTEYGCARCGHDSEHHYHAESNVEIDETFFNDHPCTGDDGDCGCEEFLEYGEYCINPDCEHDPHPGRACGVVMTYKGDGMRDETFVCDCKAERDPEWKDFVKWFTTPRCEECWEHSDTVEEVDELDCHDNVIGKVRWCANCRKGDEA